MHIDYRLRFSEHWRIGSGEGAGRHLDDLVRRDGHDLPFVPATSVRGIVRDAMRAMADAVGRPWCGDRRRREREEDPTVEPAPCDGTCPICATTGSARVEARTAWSAARLDIPSDERADVGEHVKRERFLMTRAHPRTAIDRSSGRAEDEHLFAQEETDPDLELVGRIDFDPDVRAQDVAVLVAGLRWVREIGGDRRRGLGGCRFEIVDCDLNALGFATWDDAVRGLSTPQASQFKPKRPKPATWAGPTAAAIELTAEVVGELVIGSRPERGNLSAGQAFVPGSTLRGALARLWRGTPGSPEFNAVFLSDANRFGYLYPENRTPLPLSWHECKLWPWSGGEADAHEAVDLLLDPGRERCVHPDCDGALVPLRGQFSFDARPKDKRPQLSLSPHNSIDPASQTVGDDGLFAYEAIGEGRTLKGRIRTGDAAVMASLLSHVGLTDRDAVLRLLAGKRKRSLGHLEVTIRPITATEDDGRLVPVSGSVGATVPAGRSVRIDLLTPALCVDGRMRELANLAPADLKLEARRFAAEFVANEVIGGWNAAHGLPRPDRLAIAAGSTWRLDGVSDSDFSKLVTLSKVGIGQRRNEGFGVIAVRPTEI